MLWIRPAALLTVALVTLSLFLAGNAAAAGQFELRVTAPSATQDVSTPFDVTVAIAHADVDWAGYTMQMTYDRSVLDVKGVTRSGIADCNDNSWGNPQTIPTIVAACVFQQTRDTGTTETIKFQCLKDGRSQLHLVTLDQDKIQGSTVFDANGVPIPTDLTDAEVTCGAGGPLQTVAIPTNPSQSSIDTAIAGGPSPAPGTTQVPGGSVVPGTTAIAGSPGAGGTSSSGSPAAGKTGTPAAATKSAVAARTGTAAAASTGSSSSSGSGNGWVLWTVIGAVAVAALAAGGGFLFWRRRNAV